MASISLSFSASISCDAGAALCCLFALSVGTTFSSDTYFFTSSAMYLSSSACARSCSERFSLLRGRTSLRMLDAVGTETRRSKMLAAAAGVSGRLPCCESDDVESLNF
uniref:(northern house mosquito) hypothetical protein n=1 Tax=Culex pipiens TaxID=7175 RepID=A0A8D8F5P2_CULPI